MPVSSFASLLQTRISADLTACLSDASWGAGDTDARGEGIEWASAPLDGFSLLLRTHVTSHDARGSRFQTLVGLCSSAISAVEGEAGFAQLFDGKHRSHRDLVISLYAEGLHRRLNGGDIQLMRWNSDDGLVHGNHWRASIECCLQRLRPISVQPARRIHDLFEIDELGTDKPSPVTMHRAPHVLAAEICIALGDVASARSFLRQGREAKWAVKSGFRTPFLVDLSERQGVLLEDYCNNRH